MSPSWSNAPSGIQTRTCGLSCWRRSGTTPTRSGRYSGSALAPPTVFRKYRRSWRRSLPTVHPRQNRQVPARSSRPKSCCRGCRCRRICAIASGDKTGRTNMSEWSKVTRPIPVPNEWTKPFWDAAKRGIVELQRCQSCGHFQHPPYATCTRCVATDLRFEPVRGIGTIYAYTIMYHTGDKRFAAAVPYASIIVELDDAPGALMAGNLLDAEYTEAKVGRRVEVVFEKLNDDITLPQFRLAAAASE